MINLPSFFYKLENSKKHEVSGYIENEKEKNTMIEDLETETGFIFIQQ